MSKTTTMAMNSPKRTGTDTKEIADTAKNNMFKYDGTSDRMPTNTTSKRSTSRNQTTLEYLFVEELKDIYSAEKQLIEALPKMAEAVYSEDLLNAFASHLQQTRRHAERIEKVFDRLNINREEKKCFAMEGLIRENKKIMNEFEESHVRDSALIIGAQKIEHYKIASYGSLCELADVLGYSKIKELLGRSLDEEERTDRILTMIAQDINDDAYEMSMEEEHEEIY